MSEEKDKVRTQLLDFEMIGKITQRQKDVLLRECFKSHEQALSHYSERSQGAKNLAFQASFLSRF